MAALALTGIALCLVYIASPAAAIGTSYGVMVLAKITLFAALLAMAALNHRAVTAGSLSPSGAQPEAQAEPPALAIRGGAIASCADVSRWSAGLAVVALFLAASISSTPSGGRRRARSRPRWRRSKRVLTPGGRVCKGPTLAELQATSGLGDPSVLRTPEETAWSEFGHNLSGLFILAMGVLATLEGTGWAPWARTGHCSSSD